MNNTEKIVLGGGCFWCIEATLKILRGIVNISPGYAGGNIPNPTYEQVCTGTTGHAEVVQIEYNVNEISTRDILTVFFASHDPSTLNRQGNDIGTQYRSVIFYTNIEQKKIAEQIINEIDNSTTEGDKVVTEILPLEKFYEAEDYHHDYFTKNKNQGYCNLVINPKVEKIQKQFAELLNTHSL